MCSTKLGVFMLLLCVWLDPASLSFVCLVSELVTFLNSDITALAKDRAYAQIHLDEMSIHQVNYYDFYNANLSFFFFFLLYPPM